MTHRVAIVGAGPSGFYAADGLLRANPDLHIDVIDRLPTPFGLVRAGVAPDHQGTKAVIRQFDRLLAQPDLRFAGNLEIGRDLGWDELAAAYDAVIVATGMVVDRTLGIPGEDLPQVWGSWRFVAWLNGHPDFRSGPDLSTVESVAVIGNGNVALDVARVLAKSADEMAKSDIVPEAGAAIAAAPIKEIHVIGRRGPEQASFTNNELAEMGRLARAVAVVDPAALAVEAPAGDPTPERLRKAKNLQILAGQQADHRALPFPRRAGLDRAGADRSEYRAAEGGPGRDLHRLRRRRVSQGRGHLRRRLGAPRAQRHDPDQPRRQPCRGQAGDRVASRPRSQERAGHPAAGDRRRRLASHRQARGRGRCRARPAAGQAGRLAGPAGGRAGRVIALYVVRGASSKGVSMLKFSRRGAGAVLVSALLAAVSYAAPAAAQTTLKVALHSDLKIVDPIWTTALISTHHGNMVYDTLFAMDESLAIKPQMVDKYEVSPDKLVWTFTLRDGLEWHDGQPVTAADCVASLKRWGARDSMGQKLMSVTGELSAPDAKTIRLVLKQPYGMVLESLGKSSSNVPFMMPKRLAETDPNTQIQEAIGSGPFIFKKDEWRPGEKVVYVKNPEYKPRAEPASWLAGGKVVKVDRVEWVWIPDLQTAANALMAGEIDYMESTPHDLIALLKADKNVSLFTGNPLGLQYDFRWNSIQPPFNDPRIRRAAMYAFNQKQILEAGVGDPAYYQTCKAMFVCGTPLENNAGMDGLLESNFERSKALLKEAGYDGTPVVLLHPTDLPILTSPSPVAKDLLEKGGFKVQVVPMDWQSLVARRVRKEPGAWSGFMTAWLSVDMMNPLTNPLVTAACDKAAYGWPCDAEIERLRSAFARASTLPEQQKIATELQARAIEVGTHIQLGQFKQPSAIRGDRLSGLIESPVPVFWGMSKKGN
jgi:peptide/nickel transport system substrate-binding protein